MAKVPIDLTGRAGLAIRHQGDLNDTSSKPNLRYLAGEGEMVDGVYNPFKKYGYLSPANNAITPCTGTITNEIKCVEYESVGDDMYLGSGNEILEINGLDDTSVSVFKTITTGRDITDICTYEVSGTPIVAYLTNSSVSGDGIRIGFFGTRDESGIVVLDNPVVGRSVANIYEVIGNSSTNTKLAQRYYREDADYYYGKFDKIRLRLSRLGAGTSYTIKVGIQRGDSSASKLPDGTYLAYGTIDPANLNQGTALEIEGEDVYVTLNVPVEFDTADPMWLVVEPTDIGDMTGTNSFVWYRTDNNSTLYSNGQAYAYTGSSWSTADTTSESFDFDLILSGTESWFPIDGDDKINTFSTLDSTTFGAVDTDYPVSIKFDDTHIIGAWRGEDADGFVQAFSYATADGTVAAIGSALEYDTLNGENARLDLLDSTHFIMTWENGSDVKAQIFSVNVSTYAITAVGSAITVASSASLPNVLKVSDNSVAITYVDSGGQGQIHVYRVNDSYGLVEFPNSSVYEYESGELSTAAEMVLIDSTHILISWRLINNKGYSAVLELPYEQGVNTITQDAATSSGASSTASSRTYAHTCGSDADYIVVGVYFGTIESLTSVTYGGVAMTELERSNATGKGVALFGLKYPPVGANNVVVTASVSAEIYSAAVSYVGVHPDTTFVTGVNASAASSPYTVDVTTTEDYSQVVAMAYNDTQAFTAGASTTFIINATRFAMYRPTTSPTPTAGTVTVSATYSGTATAARMVGVGFYGGGVGTPTLAGAKNEFGSDEVTNFSEYLIDTTHFLLNYTDNSTKHVVSQVYEIDGSYGIDTVGTGAIIARHADIASDVNLNIAYMTNLDIYVNTFQDLSAVGKLVTTTINSSYDVIVNGVSYEFGTNISDATSTIYIDENAIIVFYISGNVEGTIKSLRHTTDTSTNNFYIEEGQNSFMRKADNGFLYWFYGNKVSSIDGSIAGTVTGVLTRDILIFSSYTECVDAVDANGYMYIATHSNTSTTGSSDLRRFSANTAGVYVWDRLSSVVRTRDFYPVQGVREIRNIFLSQSGDVMLITISNSGACELRKLVNGRFQIVKKFEEAGYPRYKNGITVQDTMVTWLGTNGIVYAYGSVETGNPEGLFKIGSLANKASGAYTSGIMMQSNKPASGLSIGNYISWADDSTYKLSKWYPNGEGTIDSVLQIPNVGSVYSPVKLLPALSTVKHIDLYNLPIATDSTTIVGALKIYFNQSTTPWNSIPVTKHDLVKGVKHINVGVPYVNSIQLEVEWAVDAAIGNDTFSPILAEAEITPSTTINR